MKKGLIALAILMLIFVGYKNLSQNALSVEAYLVTKGSISSKVSNTRVGEVKSCQTAQLAFSRAGLVSHIHVNEGENVKQSQPLVSLWNSDLHAKVKMVEAKHQATLLQAENACETANLNNKEATRLSKLYLQKLVPEDKKDSAMLAASNSVHLCNAGKSQLQQVEAELSLQQSLLTQTHIYAPFNGIVAEINGEIGEFATPSPVGVATPPVIRLISNNCFFVEAPIDEVDAAKIKRDLPALVTLDAYPAQTFIAKVRRVSPFVNSFQRQARTVNIELNFADVPPNLLHGYSADVEIILKKHDDVVKIPNEYIFTENNSTTNQSQKYVWTIISDNHASTAINSSTIEQGRSAGKLQKQPVELGITNWEFSQITKGLNSKSLITRPLSNQVFESEVSVDFVAPHKQVQ